MTQTLYFHGLKLPFPPCSGNHYTGQAGKRRFIKPEAKNWKNKVVFLIKSYMRHHKIKQIINHHFLNVFYIYPNKKKRDSDNITKVLKDALEAAGLFTNDYICHLHAMSYTPDLKKYPKGIIIFSEAMTHNFFRINNELCLFTEEPALDYSLGYPRLLKEPKK